MPNWEVLQVMHDMANIIQEVIATTADIDDPRIERVVNRASIIIRLYTMIYRESSLEESFEYIQLCNNHTIETDGNVEVEGEMAKLVALYCLWITKYADVIVYFRDNSVEIKANSELRPLSTLQENIGEQISKRELESFKVIIGKYSIEIKNLIADDK